MRLDPCFGSVFHACCVFDATSDGDSQAIPVSRYVTEPIACRRAYPLPGFLQLFTLKDLASNPAPKNVGEIAVGLKKGLGMDAPPAMDRQFPGPETRQLELPLIL